MKCKSSANFTVFRKGRYSTETTDILKFPYIMCRRVSGNPGSSSARQIRKRNFWPRSKMTRNSVR
jgi:hypothetical protein